MTNSRRSEHWGRKFSSVWTLAPIGGYCGALIAVELEVDAFPYRWRAHPSFSLTLLAVSLKNIIPENFSNCICWSCTGKHKFKTQFALSRSFVQSCGLQINKKGQLNVKLEETSIELWNLKNLLLLAVSTEHWKKAGKKLCSTATVNDSTYHRRGRRLRRLEAN